MPKRRRRTHAQIHFDLEARSICIEVDAAGVVRYRCRRCQAVFPDKGYAEFHPCSAAPLASRQEESETPWVNAGFSDTPDCLSGPRPGTHVESAIAGKLSGLGKDHSPPGDFNCPEIPQCFDDSPAAQEEADIIAQAMQEAAIMAEYEV